MGQNYKKGVKLYIVVITTVIVGSIVGLVWTISRGTLTSYDFQITDFMQAGTRYAMREERINKLYS